MALSLLFLTWRRCGIPLGSVRGVPYPPFSLLPIILSRLIRSVRHKAEQVDACRRSLLLPCGTRACAARSYPASVNSANEPTRRFALSLQSKGALMTVYVHVVHIAS
ncbi:hypothetical protein IE53DRAFT_41740 [Violaceomyces palustris]|uniref:Uncharacterized protein n=1 Tax=Violaceomyces palustris TaxID=1673888 RepID=A0ACD0P0M8_9BASI|nr:hypothetical protein IE53DRAFT_41740 [Violaceomyces palustris]